MLMEGGITPLLLCNMYPDASLHVTIPCFPVVPCLTAHTSSWSGYGDG